MDTNDFGERYRRFHLRLYRVCLRWCQDEKLAEDLVQEAFLAVWNADPAAFPTDAQFLGYLRKAARSSLGDWFRKARNEPVTTLQSEENDNVADEDRTDPKDLLEYRELLQLVEKVCEEILAELSSNPLQSKLFDLMIRYKTIGIDGETSRHMQEEVISALLVDHPNLSKQKLISAYQSLYQRITRLSSRLPSAIRFQEICKAKFSSFMYGNERGGSRAVSKGER